MQRSFTDRVRSFNRTVTLGTGALDDSYLGRGRPLGQARLLFEIEPDGTEITTLRTRLDLDSGYASRLLRALESEGLVVLEEDRNDRRRRLVRPTAKGLAEQAAYDSLSDVLVTSLLDRLNETQRNRLVEAMGEVERLLTAGSITIAAEPEDSPDAQRCISAYFSELAERFEGGFDPGAGGYAGKAAETPAHGAFLLARLHGKAVGCGGLKQFDDRTGEIKRMWVAPAVRGLGLSRRLLEALEAEAVRAGMTRVVLDTNRSLAEAQSLYRKAGYRQIERYNDNAYADFWFEKRVGR
ncbi:MAG: MarR family transcriptional regulator [Rhizobiaceae bacterium]|nr:MarR family transcriptional regulator [Rhizobiaceae bacterium]